MAFDDLNADINNVGSIALALYANANPTYDEIEASAWQTTQVSILSICNWAGRIVIGSISSVVSPLAQTPCRPGLGLHADPSPHAPCIQFVYRVLVIHNLPDGSN